MLQAMRLVFQAALVWVYLFVGAALAQGVIHGRVVKAVDGDTVHVLQGRQTYKVRLGAIDAPERKQPFSVQSQKSLAQLVAGKDAVVRWHKKDQYQRLVGVVLVDGTDIGLAQIQRGMAWHFTRFAREQRPADRSAYASAQQGARMHGRGLWRDSAPVPPWDWRNTHRNRTSGRRGT